MYQEGVRAFNADIDVFGDPAPGEFKHLVLAWEFCGKVDEKTTDPNSGEIVLPEGSLGDISLKILKASYGPADIIEKIVDMYQEGTRAFSADVDIFGDPAPGEFKHLVIIWELKGQTHEMITDSNSGEIYLPDGNIQQDSLKLLEAKFGSADILEQVQQMYDWGGIR